MDAWSGHLSVNQPASDYQKRILWSQTEANSDQRLRLTRRKSTIMDVSSVLCCSATWRFAPFSKEHIVQNNEFTPSGQQVKARRKDAWTSIPFLPLLFSFSTPGRVVWYLYFSSRPHRISTKGVMRISTGWLAATDAHWWTEHQSDIIQACGLIHHSTCTSKHTLCATQDRRTITFHIIFIFSLAR